MKANYNVTGEERKALVKAIEKIIGDKAVYQFMPTCAYKIGGITVSKEGAVSCEDDAKLEKLIGSLSEAGYEPAKEESEADGPTLTISLPADAANTDILKNLIASKRTLIKKSLDAVTTEITASDEKIEFPWFDRELTPEETKAYTRFFSALCKLSKELNRCSGIEHTVENEKYAFRCFILRLGFIGSDYKEDRKILLKNLSGNSAFKSGARKEA
jgi:hypothetical protein